MHANLRGSPGRPGGRGWAAAAAAAIAVLGLGFGAGPLRAAMPETDAERARRSVNEARRALDRSGLAVEESWRELTFRGRPALELKAKAADPDGARRFYDFAVYDLGARRLVVYIFFPHASRREAGEAILPISEVSMLADAHLRSVVPETTLALESVQRQRTPGQEGVYYEVRYAPQTQEIRLLRAPVRLLVEAVTGRLFRFDVDPEWIDPLPVPKNRITRQAAERIAAVALQGHELAVAFGAGARLGKVVGAEQYYVLPNGWLGLAVAETPARARVAWLVGFTLDGAAAAGPHSLFVDAATGRILGGMEGSP